MRIKPAPQANKSSSECIRNPAGSPTARPPMGRNASGARHFRTRRFARITARRTRISIGQCPGIRPDDRSVRELMICHPDARGPSPPPTSSRSASIERPRSPASRFRRAGILLTHQVVVSTPLTIRTAGSGGTSLRRARAAPINAPCSSRRLTCWRRGAWLFVWSTNNVDARTSS